MAVVRLIHWKPEEAEDLVASLEDAGHTVDAAQFAGPDSLRGLRDAPPDAVIIDLSRLPSQGRDLGIALRVSPATRTIPLVFVGGAPNKVAGVRAHLPDASYTDWGRLKNTLREALAADVGDVIVPASVMAAYHGKPLAAKLGLTGDTGTIRLMGVPDGISAVRALLPSDHVAVGRDDSRDLTVWFVEWRATLERELDEMGRLAEGGRLWIAWPKRASQRPTDLSQATVRQAGLDRGLVDFKICSLDPTWSGLRFSRR